MSRPVLPPLVLALVLLLVVPGASATEISGAQLADLAARAQSDPGALEELRRVTSVAGRPVDMEAVLDVAPATRAARLESLAKMGDAATVAPAAELQESALSILSRPEYQLAEGARGQSAQAWLVDLIFRHFPEPVARVLTNGWFWIGAGLLALGLILRLAFRTSRRRAQQFGTDLRLEPTGGGGMSADEMEAAAAAAEASGRLDEAVRLRFRAGLLRLGEIGAIRYTDSISTAAVRNRIGSADFDAVAGTFDRVHYGKRGAEQGDVDDARERWSRVLASARGRHE